MNVTIAVLLIYISAANVLSGSYHDASGHEV